MKLLANHWYLIKIDNRQHVAKFESVTLDVDPRFSTFRSINGTRVFAYNMYTNKPIHNTYLGDDLAIIQQNFPELFI